MLQSKIHRARIEGQIKEQKTKKPHKKVKRNHTEPEETKKDQKTNRTVNFDMLRKCDAKENIDSSACLLVAAFFGLLAGIVRE